jgi:hypothetical protein
VGLRAGLDMVAKRKIPSSYQGQIESIFMNFKIIRLRSNPELEHGIQKGVKKSLK